MLASVLLVFGGAEASRADHTGLAENEAGDAVRANNLPPAPGMQRGSADGRFADHNVLLIMLDDLNTDITAYGGRAMTPNIDRLAGQGTRFDHGYSVVPACNPSRVALLTGQRPETTGQYANPGNFRELPGGAERTTLPQYLRANGYETVAAGKIFHKPRGRRAEPDPQSDPQSWDRQAKVRTGTNGHDLYLDEDGWAKWLRGKGDFEGKRLSTYMRKFGVWGPVPGVDERHGDYHTAAYCADYLKGAGDRKFMLACGIFRPHSPQLAPQKYFDLYPIDSVQLPVAPGDDLADVPRIAKNNFSSSFARKVRSDPEEWRRAVQGYYASISFADAAVGVILDALETSGRAEDTIVVLVGDHGFQLGQKNRWEKFTLWTEGSRTTMIMRLPGLGGTIAQPVSFLDIYPTVLSALGLDRPEFIEGSDLMPLLSDPASDWDQPIVTTYERGNNSVRWRDWNYIRYEDGSEELYDLAVDPHELTNLVARGRGRHGTLIKALRAHISYASQGAN